MHFGVLQCSFIHPLFVSGSFPHFFCCLGAPAGPGVVSGNGNALFGVIFEAGVVFLKYHLQKDDALCTEPSLSACSVWSVALFFSEKSEFTLLLLGIDGFISVPTAQLLRISDFCLGQECGAPKEEKVVKDGVW